MNWLKSQRFLSFKESFFQALLAFPHFLKNPIQGMRDLPDWEWPILITLQAVLGLVSGVLAAILTRSVLTMITSFFISPISTVVVGFILSGFFYYTFLFFFKREVSFKLVYTHLLFASIPVLLTSIASPIIPLIGVLGVIAAGFLLYVGFLSNLHLPSHGQEKKMRFLLIGLVSFYVLSVVYQTVDFSKTEQRRHIKATPESMDILEEELKRDN